MKEKATPKAPNFPNSHVVPYFVHTPIYSMFTFLRGPRKVVDDRFSYHPTDNVLINSHRIKVHPINYRHHIKHWIQAMRLKTLTASLTPLLCASAFAFKEVKPFLFSIFICTLGSVLCLQITTNLFNDALDFLKGADTPHRLGPPRVTAQNLFAPKTVLGMAFLFALFAVLFSIPLLQKEGLPILILGLVSLILTYAYTGGPFPLAYFALGDFFVLCFFGWVATGGTYFLQVGKVSPEIFLLGTQMGILATSLIAINNLRDIKSDAQSGKKTLATLIGIQGSRWEILLCLMLPYVLNLFWGFQKNLWWATVLPFFSLPLALYILRRLFKEAPSKNYNLLLAKSAQHQLLFGLSFSVGILLPY